MNFEELLESYGVWAVLIGSCFEGEMVNTLAGIGARAGYLPWPWVILLGWSGTFLATQAWFLAGKYAGEAVLKRRPQYQPKVDKATTLLHRRGIWVFVFYRFLYGLRTITPFAIGMTGVSTIKFMVIDGLCWLLWLGALATLGYAIGETALHYIEIISQYQKWLLLAFLLGVGVILLRRRKTKQT